VNVELDSTQPVSAQPLGPAGPAWRVMPRREQAAGPAIVWYSVVAAFCVIGMFSANPLLTLACVVVLAGIVKLLWRAGEPPMLAMAVALQWSQVATLVFQADVDHVSVTKLSTANHVEDALWLGLFGLIVLSIGIRFGMRGLRHIRPSEVQAQLRHYSLDRLFLIYAVLAISAVIAPYFIWRVLPVSQLVLNFVRLRWALYYLLGYLTLTTKRRPFYFAAATVLEFLIGIGFFAEFKTVFLVGAMAFFGLQYRMTLKRFTIAGGVIAALFAVSLVWTNIKRDYRQYLNGGSKQQVILVSPWDRLTTFGEMASETRLSDLKKGTTEFFHRVSYVEFFGAALDYVPLRREHTGGSLLWAAIAHVLVPRLIYPSKPVLPSDTELTSEYTGRELGNAYEGKSISMGYMVENYIDFGRALMFVPILLIGVSWGAMYAYLVRKPADRGLGYGCGVALMLYATQFEIAEVKLIGGMLTMFIITALTLKFAGPAARRWLSSEPPLSLVRPRMAWQRTSNA